MNSKAHFYAKQTDAMVQAALSSESPQQSRQKAKRGRGAATNRGGRFELIKTEPFDDGWHELEDDEPLRTEVQIERPKTIITRNQSPDLPFDRSINPYRGCEHGCSYCFARPTHAYMGLSAGLDFESKLFAKPSAPFLLVRELAAPNYKPHSIAMGTNTDPYQPIERHYRITRSILKILNECSHPVGLVTKSALVTRDVDILSEMADRNLAKVAISITSLDPKLARCMEPRASTPAKRLSTIEMLVKAGIPVAVMAAPMIPALNDRELEGILKSARDAGASEANYILLRLPGEVSDIFREWLLRHYPDRFQHVMNLVKSMRLSGDNDAEFGRRMQGNGPYAKLLRRRFEVISKKLDFSQKQKKLDCDQFQAPKVKTNQLSLFTEE